MEENGLLKEVNFRIYGVMNWERNNYNTDVVQYLKK